MDRSNEAHEHGEDHGHNHGHGHDHDHGHDHVPPPDTSEAQSLYPYIYHDQISALNENVPNSGQTIFKKWQDRLDSSKILDSDVDEQLVIYVPFTGLVRLHSLLIRSTNDNHAPKNIKLFKNRDDIDFSLASELPAVASIYHPHGVGGQEQDQLQAVEGRSLHEEGIAEYALSRALFSNITNLTIFIQDNHGEETTKILYIGLRGEWTKLSKDPVITLYEAAANPADHKNRVGQEHLVPEGL